MRKLLFLFCVALCFVACNVAPSLDVKGYGLVEYDKTSDTYFVELDDDNVYVVDKVLSDRGEEKNFSYESPVAGTVVVCYQISHKSEVEFAYDDIDLRRVKNCYNPKETVQVFFCIFITILFILIACFIREKIS